jgi:hypothetical protein
MQLEQFRIYQEERRVKFLAMARERLGGKCSHSGCEKTENLEFDHIVPGSKLRKISEATNWSLEHFLEEVDKCQLLCREHHQQKTTEAGERARGERNGHAKLTESVVLAIRKSDLSYAELALRYEVSKTAITEIRLGRTWKHTGGPVGRRPPGRKRKA